MQNSGKLWDHFNGTHSIGVLTQFSTWLWGQTIVKQQVETWVHQNENDVSPNIPEIFMCPITHEMMVHPVINNCGRIYEKQALESWLIVNNRDPETNLQVSLNSLRPVRELEYYIREYAQKSGFVLYNETNTTIV